MTAVFTAEPLPGIQAGGSHRPLTTKREAIRQLMGLGITGPQAQHLYRAYEADVADAVRIGNDTGRSDTAFLAWLMEQPPLDIRQPRRRPRPSIGQPGSGWAVTS